MESIDKGRKVSLEPSEVWRRRGKCPRCDSGNYWNIRGQKRRCARCRYEWRAARLPLRLTPPQWQKLLRWFVRDLSSAAIAKEAQLHRQRVLRALKRLREAIAQEVSADFHPTEPVEEVYLARRRKAGAGQDPRLIYGIIYDGGRVWLRSVSEAEANQISPLIRLPRKKGAFAAIEIPAGSDREAEVPALEALPRHRRPARRHTHRLRGFLGYLKSRLAGKGGIRSERFSLYLAEYVWRYNHRRESLEDQAADLMKLVRRRTT